MPSTSRRPARPSKSAKRAGKAGRAPKAAKRSAKRPAKAARKATKKAAKRAPAKRPAKRPAKKAAVKPVKRAAKPARPARPKAPVMEFSEVSKSDRRLRVALFGGSGNLGRRIAAEAARRGHQVTALVRDPGKATGLSGVRVVRGDVTDPVQVEVVARNHDVVVSAIAPPPSNPGVLVEAAKALAAVSRATGRRVVVVGGAGSLEVAPGVQLLDSPGFPAEWRPVAVAHRDALQAMRSEGGGNWTVVSPSALIEPGERTGKFRLGTDSLLKDRGGNSRISMEDYAVAVVDELESGRSRGMRITVGY